MKAEDGVQDDGVAAMRDLHRRAAAQVDPAPDPSVRAAVLAAAARAVDARPQAMDATPVAAPFGRRRWPVSMAALLVVSLMTGLIVNQAVREEPDRVTSVGTSPAPTTPAPSPAPVTPPDSSGTTREAAEARQPASRDARPPSRIAPERLRADRGRNGDGVRDAAPLPSADTAAQAAKIAPSAEPVPSRGTLVPPPPPAPAPVPSSKAQEVAPSLPASSADETPSVARPAPAVNTAQRLRRGPEPLTPEAWVQRILKLREAGDGPAADREVEALRARYPDFLVPPAALGPTGTR